MATFLAAIRVFAAFDAGVMVAAATAVAGGGRRGGGFLVVATTRFAAGRKEKACGANCSQKSQCFHKLRLSCLLMQFYQ
jgi:hypothetical protein